MTDGHAADQEPTEKPEKPERSERSPKRDALGRHLLKSRTVLVFGPIEPRLTREVVTQLLVLDQASKTEPIKMLINSPGGLADDGFAIFDLMRWVSAPVYSICAGLAASAATIVMLGTRGRERRLILPHARVMLHQPSQGFRGTASDIAISAKEILRLREKANKLFAQETGHPVDKIEMDMHRDYWMTSEESVAYGLCDRVVESEKDILSTGSAPGGPGPRSPRAPSA
jgi:ATP-dependent Clp protease protease subunit